MILRELFSNNVDSTATTREYSADRDFTTVKRDDTRKTRLTLRQINQLRKASESHILEQEKELEFVQQMYKMPEAPAV